jgi:PAS domain-containing protein
MAIAIKEKRAVRGMEAVAERPDGTRGPFEPYPTPIFDSDGNLTGAVNMLIEITDRKRAEQAKQHLAAIVEFSDDAIISINLHGIIQSGTPPLSVFMDTPWVRRLENPLIC